MESINEAPTLDVEEKTALITALTEEIDALEVDIKDRVAEQARLTSWRLSLLSA